MMEILLENEMLGYCYSFKVLLCGIGFSFKSLLFLRGDTEAGLTFTSQVNEPSLNVIQLWLEYMTLTDESENCHFRLTLS